MSRKQFVVILIITFIVILIWFVADIIHTKPSVPLNPKLETLLDPINPNFDQNTLKQIEQNQLPLLPNQDVSISTNSTNIKR